MLGIDGEYPVGHPKDILTVALENCQKRAIKHWTRKYILPNFVSLSTTVCSRLSDRTYFDF